MTKDDIISLPNSRLRTRSVKVGIIDDTVRKLVADMEAATLDWEASREHEVGVALAAVQIDSLLRVVVVREDFDDKHNHNFTVLINPEISKYEGEVKTDFEGCLSIPDVYGKVPRHAKVKIKALNLEGKQIRMTAEGFLARVLQHEIDHTNGVVFIDHIKDSPEAFYKIMEDGHLEPQNYDQDIKENVVLWSM